MKCIHVNESKTAGPKILLVPFGDLHVGAKESNEKKIDEYIDWIKNNKNARVILMGDIMNLGSRDSVGGGVFDDIIEPQEQYNLVLEKFRPIKDRIWGLLAGNHEENRIRSKTSFDLSKMLAKALGVAFGGFGCYFKVRYGSQNYIIYATHGSSGATKAHTRLKAVTDLSGHFDAEIYLHGHLHELESYQGLFYRVSKRHAEVVKGKRLFVLTGHYLDYEGSYAQAKNMRPTKLGSPKIKLYKDEHDFHCSI